MAASLFTALQRERLTAIIDRLIPADADNPGALATIGETGIVAALQSPRYAADVAPLAAWLDTIGPLPTAADPLDHLLHTIEANQVPHVSAAPFARLVTITAELFYGSPETTAGDRTTPAWRMLGYRPRPLSPHA